MLDFTIENLPKNLCCLTLTTNAKQVLFEWH